MVIIGLTGVVASGKTTTAAMFARLGAGVFDADKCVHDFYDSKAGIAAVRDIIPRAVMGGRVNRRVLSSVISLDAEILDRLEVVVHAHVGQCRCDFILEMARLGKDIVILDIPLLFETGGDVDVDKTVVTTARDDIIRARLLAREGVDETLLSVLLSRQLTDSEKRLRADYVIDTSDGFDRTFESVCALMDEWRLCAAKSKKGKKGKKGKKEMTL